MAGIAQYEEDARKTLIHDSLTPGSIEAYYRWSLETFGPGERTLAVLRHIEKELDEVAAAPDDVVEWADVIILAIDGAMRQGHTVRQIFAAIKAKHAKNMRREWPDWRLADPDQPIEHVRVGDKLNELPGAVLDWDDGLREKLREW